jgi:hypothetical protein
MRPPATTFSLKKNIAGSRFVARKSMICPIVEGAAMWMRRR